MTATVMVRFTRSIVLLTIALMIAPKPRGINVFTPASGRYIIGVEYASMTSLLQDFRRQLEHASGGPVQELDQVNAAMLINDLCVFLGLSDQNRRKILGARAAMFVDAALLEAARSSLRH